VRKLIGGGVLGLSVLFAVLFADIKLKPYIEAVT